MANIPNRALYGLLGCLKGIIDSRFTKINNEIALHQLKHNSKYSINPIDVCPGGNIFSSIIGKQLNRKRYCPLLDSSTDSRMCEWVHAINNDPQKSKPVGQCAIILESLGLAKLIRTKAGIIKGLKWNLPAFYVKKYDFQSSELNHYFCDRIMEYGPALGILFQGFTYAKNCIFDRKNITQFIRFPISNDRVDVKCNCNNIYTRCILPDGNTSMDAAVRSTTSLLCLAASAGLIFPYDKSYKCDILNNSPSIFYFWYIAEPNRKCPIKWKINKQIYDMLHHTKFKFKRGISYDNLVPKSTDRNSTNNCKACGSNIVNLAKKQYINKVKNRRYLLLESLRLAYDLGKSISLEALANVSLMHSQFIINKTTHFRALKSDIQVAFLTGYDLNIVSSTIKPLIGAEKTAFEPIPNEIKALVERIIIEPGVLI